jgi:hypothetical protein
MQVVAARRCKDSARYLVMTQVLTPYRRQQVRKGRGLAPQQRPTCGAGKPCVGAGKIGIRELLHPLNVDFTVRPGTGKNKLQHLACVGAALALSQPIKTYGFDVICGLPGAARDSINHWR